MVAHQNTSSDDCSEDIRGSDSEHEVPIPILRGEGRGGNIINHNNIAGSSGCKMADGETEKT